MHSRVHDDIVLYSGDHAEAYFCPTTRLSGLRCPRWEGRTGADVFAMQWVQIELPMAGCHVVPIRQTLQGKGECHGYVSCLLWWLQEWTMMRTVVQKACYLPVDVDDDKQAEKKWLAP